MYTMDLHRDERGRGRKRERRKTVRTRRAPNLWPAPPTVFRAIRDEALAPKIAARGNQGDKRWHLPTSPCDPIPSHSSPIGEVLAAKARSSQEPPRTPDPREERRGRTSTSTRRSCWLDSSTSRNVVGPFDFLG